MSFYIALEGIDGAGKTSCQAELARWLRGQGQEVVCVREPGYTDIGKFIRQYILRRSVDISLWGEAAMFAADRAELVAKTILPALDRGEWVLSDRSVYSSLAYQGLAQDLGLDAVRRVNEEVMDGVWPHLVVLLEVETGLGLSRQEDADRIGGKDRCFMSLVSYAYDQLAEREPELFVRVEARSPVELVVQQVARRIRESQNLTLWTGEWVHEEDPSSFEPVLQYGDG